MSFESILTYVGRFGRYQIFIFCLVGVFGLLGAFVNVGIVFIAPKVDHWCSVPDLDRFNLSDGEYKLLVAPKDDKCQRYDLNFSTITEVDILSWNETIARLKPKLIACDNGWIFDESMFSYTATEQYSMVCHRSYLISIASSVFMGGLLVGAVTSGALADRFGRRTAFLVMMGFAILAPSLTAFMPYYALFALMRFFCGFVMIGGYTAGFVLGTEMLATEYRMYAGVILHTSFSLGIMLLPGMAYLITSHVWLQLTFGLLYIPFAIINWFIVPESPRWLVAKGRDDEAYVILERIARAVNTMVYYGLTYGVGSLGGNLYLNTFLSGAVEIPSYIAMLFGLNKIGRRCTLGGALLLAGVSCYVMVALMHQKGIGLMIMAMFGKFFISISFSVIYLYTTEIYPTAIRNVGLGAGSTCARVGGLLAPQIGELQRFWLPMPAAVFGGVSLLGGILTFLLPESTGRDLPQTVTEAENFGKDDPFTLNCFESVRRRPSRYPMGTANPAADEDTSNEIHSLSTNKVAHKDPAQTNQAFDKEDAPAHAQKLVQPSKQTDV